jgi:SulP family sulfate permease
VVAGFTSAAALIIGASQLGHVLGLDLPRSHHVHETLLRAVQGLPDVHGPTLAVATASVVGLVGLKRYAPTVPRFLVVVGLAGAAVWGLDLASHGVKVVGQVPAGLPTPAVPALPWAELPALLPTALTIALVGFLESISVAQRFARQEGYAIDADQELVALGAANLGGSLFGGYPVTGGFSRTAVNAQAGAVSGLASLVTAGAVVLTLLFLTPLFTHLPKATLAAIILTAVAGLVDVAEARHLYRVSRPDLAAMGLTFVATLALGIEPGILAGVAGSLLWFIWRTSRPHTAELGYCPQIDVYRNLDRYPQAERIPGVVVLRIDGPLYFANTAFLQQTVRDVLRDDTRHLVLDANAIPSVDAQALDTMATVLAELADRGVQVWVSGARGPVRDQVRRAHLALDSDHVVEKVQDAVARIAPRPTLVAVEHPVG